MAPSRAISLACAARRQLFRSSIQYTSSTPRIPLSSTRYSLARTFTASPARPSPSLQPPTTLDESEGKIFAKLNTALEPESLTVQDVSGGCGSMYALDIISARFTGLSVIKQHKLVNQILADDIKGWHGVQLKTKAPA